MAESSSRSAGKRGKGGQEEQYYEFRQEYYNNCYVRIEPKGENFTAMAFFSSWTMIYEDADIYHRRVLLPKRLLLTTLVVLHRAFSC